MYIYIYIHTHTHRGIVGGELGTEREVRPGPTGRNFNGLGQLGLDTPKTHLAAAAAYGERAERAGLDAPATASGTRTAGAVLEAARGLAVASGRGTELELPPGAECEEQLENIRGAQQEQQGN